MTGDYVRFVDYVLFWQITHLKQSSVAYFTGEGYGVRVSQSLWGPCSRELSRSDKKNLGAGGGMQSGWLSLRQKERISLPLDSFSGLKIYNVFATGAPHQRFNFPNLWTLASPLTDISARCWIQKFGRVKGIRHHKIFIICNVVSQVGEIAFFYFSESCPLFGTHTTWREHAAWEPRRGAFWDKNDNINIILWTHVEKKSIIPKKSVYFLL